MCLGHSSVLATALRSSYPSGAIKPMRGRLGWIDLGGEAGMTAGELSDEVLLAGSAGAPRPSKPGRLDRGCG